MKYQDPFIFESLERVISIERERDFAILEFTDTIFYPGGGGQPRDHGTIIINGIEYEVKDAYKNKTSVLHKIEVPYNIELIPGMAVELKIDKKRREQLTRMHTGEHLFMGSLLKIIPELQVEKIHLEEDESSLFIIPPKQREITWEDIFKAEKIANKIIQQDRKVSIHMVNRDDVKRRFPKARIKLDRIQSDTIRVIEIEDHDYSACAGVHCAKTSFIGNLIVIKFSKVQDKYEVKFKVNSAKDLFELSRYTRETASELKINPSELKEFTANLMKKNNEMKAKIRDLQSGKQLNIKEEKANDVTIRYSFVENFDKKQITDKLNENFDEKKEKQLMLIFNKTDKGTQFSMKTSKEIEDAGKILKDTGMKGGGREQFAQGISEDPEKTINNLKSYFS